MQAEQKKDIEIKYIEEQIFNVKDFAKEPLIKGEYENCIFKNSQLQETDFAESDLTGAKFDNCNLRQAIFDHTILEKVDFRTSYNDSIEPETNHIKKAKFSVSGLSGLLGIYDIEIEE
jgi:fluoroquinolone resistance protein